MMEARFMIAFSLSPALLGRTRFAFSLLAETAAAMHLLASPTVCTIHQPWLRLAQTDG